MKILDTTAGSTHAVNVAVQTYMPPDEATAVLAYLDGFQVAALELERLKAEVQRLTPDSAHARQRRSDKLEALILLALDGARLRADLMALQPCFRVSKVIAHLNYFREDHGNVAKRYDIKKAPCRKKVREILIKHNLM